MGFPHPGTGQSMRRIRYKSGNIQSIIMLSFSLLSLAIMLVTVVVMYIKFADASQDSIIESNHKVMDQTIDSVESYLVNMKHLKKFQCREATLDNGMILRVGEKSYAENKQKFLLWKGWQ